MPTIDADSTIHPTDRSLLARLRDGDEDAATRLYYRYVRRLHGATQRKIAGALSRRIEPEDLVQSAFRSFFRRASAGQFDVPVGEDLWRLLLTIALNKARNAATHHRAAKRDVGKSVSDAHAHEAAAADEEARRVLELTIDELTDGLEPVQKRIIELRIAGEEVAAIARATNRSVRSIERVLQGFRAELSALLQPEIAASR